MKPIKPFEPVVLEREWGQEVIVAQTPHYMAKVLHYRAGKAGGLQLHRMRRESFHLLSGLAVVESDDGKGNLISQEMKPGQTFDIPIDAPHRFRAVEDCIVIEGSTPILEDRVRLESHYGVPVIGDGPGLPTTGEMPA